MATTWEIEPLIGELEEIGRMHECRMSPVAVREIAYKLRKTLGLGMLTGMPSKHQSIVEQLRQAVRESPVSRYRLSQASGIRESLFSQFLRDDDPTVPRLDTAERIARSCGFDLTLTPRRGTSSRASKRKGG